jgi:hypothetical protein
MEKLLKEREKKREQLQPAAHGGSASPESIADMQFTFAWKD